MAFCLLADETVEDGIERIVREEISQTIKEIDSPRLKRAEVIHEVRKHCKKIRGVLRLVRPQFDKTYQFENVWFRDTATGLAELRDAEAITGFHRPKKRGAKSPGQHNRCKILCRETIRFW